MPGMLKIACIYHNYFFVILVLPDKYTMYDSNRREYFSGT